VNNNDYLDYALTMAVADGLLKSAEYVEYLRHNLQTVDLETEYNLIRNYKTSRLSAVKRRQILALMEYTRAKESKGPVVVAENGVGSL